MNLSLSLRTWPSILHIKNFDKPRGQNEGKPSLSHYLHMPFNSQAFVTNIHMQKTFKQPFPRFFSHQYYYKNHLTIETVFMFVYHICIGQ